MSSFVANVSMCKLGTLLLPSVAPETSAYEYCKRVHGQAREVRVPGHKQAYECPGRRLLLLDLF